MQEFSEWTWRRSDRSEYNASAIPALWRRVTDRDWLAAQSEFGPLAYHDDLIRALNTDTQTGVVTYGTSSRGEKAALFRDAENWQVLHNRLQHVAALWIPSTNDPTIHALDTFALERDRYAAALRVVVASIAGADGEGELVPALDGWHLRVKPQSLRALLLMDCVGDIAARQRFRRCDHCSEWFPVARADARFCSPSCRQATHIANKTEK